MPKDRFSDSQFETARFSREGGILSVIEADSPNRLRPGSDHRQIFRIRKYAIPPAAGHLFAIPIWLRCCNEAVTVGTDNFNAFDIAPIFAIGRFCIYSCTRSAEDEARPKVPIRFLSAANSARDFRTALETSPAVVSIPSRKKASQSSHAPRVRTRCSKS